MHRKMHRKRPLATTTCKSIEAYPGPQWPGRGTSPLHASWLYKLTVAADCACNNGAFLMTADSQSLLSVVICIAYCLVLPSSSMALIFKCQVLHQTTQYRLQTTQYRLQISANHRLLSRLSKQFLFGTNHHRPSMPAQTSKTPDG